MPTNYYITGWAMHDWSLQAIIHAYAGSRQAPGRCSKNLKPLRQFSLRAFDDVDASPCSRFAEKAVRGGGGGGLSGGREPLGGLFEMACWPSGRGFGPADLDAAVDPTQEFSLIAAGSARPAEKPGGLSMVFLEESSFTTATGRHGESEVDTSSFCVGGPGRRRARAAR